MSTDKIRVTEMDEGHIDYLYWVMLALQTAFVVVGYRLSPYRSAGLEAVFLGGEGGPGVGLMFASAIVTTALLLAVDFVFWSRFAEPLAGEILAQLSYPKLVVLFLAVAFGEEILFRGWLQPTVGLFISSVLFGILHGIGREKWMAPVLETSLVGFVLGCIFLKTGALLIPVAIHFFFNLLLVIAVKEGFYPA